MNILWLRHMLFQSLFRSFEVLGNQQRCKENNAKYNLKHQSQAHWCNVLGQFMRAHDIGSYAQVQHVGTSHAQSSALHYTICIFPNVFHVIYCLDKADVMKSQ